MKGIIAFDCDGTLEISKGPVLLHALKMLQNQGWQVGICGNWQLAKKNIDSLDFYRGEPKGETLKQEGREFEVKIFVGDTLSDEKVAQEVGWKFIYAKDFKLEEILKND